MRGPALVSLVALLALGSCATLKGLFTAEGAKLNQAKALEAQGQSLGASALAAEALALDRKYREAETLLLRVFGAGQTQFAGLQAEPDPTDSTGWDRRALALRWQQSLALGLPALNLGLRAEPVTAELARVLRQTALAHWDRARLLLDRQPGPRQARLALAEARSALSADPEVEGLAAWTETAAEAATQRLMVLPFHPGDSLGLGPVPALLALQVSRRLETGPLPELTTVYSSARLVSLSSPSAALAGLETQTGLRRLAAEAGQNLILTGQMVRTSYQEPRKTEEQVLRQKTAVLIDPDHPAGIEKTYRALVTRTTWRTRLAFEAQFTVTEVATGTDLASRPVAASAEDQVVMTTFQGDSQALTADDQRGLAQLGTLLSPSDLRDKVLAGLAASIASAVRTVLD